MIPAPPKRCHSGLVRVRSKLKFYRNQVTCWYKFCEGRLTASQNKTRAHCQQKHYCRHSCILTLLHRMFGRAPTIFNHKHRRRNETSPPPVLWNPYSAGSLPASRAGLLCSPGPFEANLSHREPIELFPPVHWI